MHVFIMRLYRITLIVKQLHISAQCCTKENVFKHCSGHECSQKVLDCVTDNKRVFKCSKPRGNYMYYVL